MIIMLTILTMLKITIHILQKLILVTGGGLDITMSAGATFTMLGFFLTVLLLLMFSHPSVCVCTLIRALYLYTT